MRILALDTSSDRVLLSLGSTDSDTPEAGLVSSEKNHGPGLLVHMQALFAGQAPDVDAVACGRGPGSFTGVRIALSFAKAFAWARRIPLVTFDVFELHFTLVPSDGELWVLEEARRGELYAAARRDGATSFGPAVITLEEVWRQAGPGARFLGSGARLHEAALGERYGAASVAGARLLPDAAALHRAATVAAAAGGPGSAVTAEPMYLRASDAEVNLAVGRIRSSWNRVVPGLPVPDRVVPGLEAPEPRKENP